MALVLRNELEHGCRKAGRMIETAVKNSDGGCIHYEKCCNVKAKAIGAKFDARILASSRPSSYGLARHGVYGYGLYGSSAYGIRPC